MKLLLGGRAGGSGGWAVVGGRGYFWCAGMQKPEQGVASSPFIHVPDTLPEHDRARARGSSGEREAPRARRPGGFFAGVKFLLNTHAEASAREDVVRA